MAIEGCATVVFSVIVATIIGHVCSEPLTFAATCDDNLDFYADGVLQGSSEGLNYVLTFEHVTCPQVAAVYCEDVGIKGGIRASFGNSHVSYVTDVSWKCLATDDTPPDGWNMPGFDDSSWGAAVMLPGRFFQGTFPGISEVADWIWTTTTIGANRNVYCRKLISSCGPEPTTTESSTEVPTTTESMDIVNVTTDSLSFAATCNDNLDFYADGVLQGSSEGLNNVLTFEHATCPQVAAVYCENVGMTGGIRASFGNSHVSYVTDVSWKCLATDDTPPDGWNMPGFDDSSWDAAVQLADTLFRGTFPGISNVSDWIWTTATVGQDKDVYCRKLIAGCDPEQTTTEVPTTTETKDIFNVTTGSDTSGASTRAAHLNLVSIVLTLYTMYRWS